MTEVNILTASSITYFTDRRTVEDDYSVAHSSLTPVINLASSQAVKIVSCVITNISDSTAYDISVGTSDSSGSNFAYLYEDHSLAANTTWIPISPAVTGPIFLAENGEFRVTGENGSETNCYITTCYEYILP